MASPLRAEQASFFGGATFARRAFRASLWTLLLTLAGAGVSFYAAHRVEVVIERQVEAVLGSTQGLVVSGLRGQLDFALAATKDARTSAALRDFARACQSAEPTCNDGAFDEAVHAHASKGAMDFALFLDDTLAPRAYSRSTGASSSLSREAVLDAATPAALRTLAERAHEREVVLGAARVGQAVHLLFATRLPQAPSDAQATRAGATLVFGWPTRHWKKILESAKLGDTGESYVVDARGVLLSESRFVTELRERGLIDSGSSSSLSLGVRDPGTKDAPRALGERARWPLTHAASEVVQGRQGVALTPYRDYRGVPVVGAYAFLPEL